MRRTPAYRSNVLPAPQVPATLATTSDPHPRAPLARASAPNPPPPHRLLPPFLPGAALNGQWDCPGRAARCSRDLGATDLGHCSRALSHESGFCCPRVRLACRSASCSALGARGRGSLGPVPRLQGQLRERDSQSPPPSHLGSGREENSNQSPLRWESFPEVPWPHFPDPEVHLLFPFRGPSPWLWPTQLPQANAERTGAGLWRGQHRALRAKGAQWDHDATGL